MNEDKNEDSLSGEMSSSFSDLNSVEFQQNELIVNDGATCSFVNPTDIRDSSKSIEQVRKYSPNCMDSIEDQIPQNLIKRTISTTMLMKRKRGTTKQNSDESDWSSDVEEFAGFDVTCNGKSAFTPKRKIKEEPSTSDVDQISTNTTMENEKDVIKIEKEDSQEGDISNKGNEKVSQNESIKVRSESTRTSPNATAITSTTLMMDYNNDIKIIKKSPNLYDESEFTSVESTTTTTVPPSQLYATDDTETNIPTSSTTSLQITTATSTPTISTVTTPSSLITGKKLIDVQYLKPFEFGWKREFVLRANINDDKRIKGDKGEIYYIAPNGKRLRTKNYIHGYLHDGLELNNFTFSKEPLGVGPEHEIIRYAKPKPQQPVKRVPNFLDIGVPDPLFGFGKRIPKPKMPKGASPPPPSVQSPRISTSPAIMNTIKSRMLSASARKSDITISENESKSVPQKTTKGTINKNKGEPCTIQCVLAMGTIPQLRCKKCLCLFHHECVGLEKFDGPIPSYICESCLYEIAPPTQQQQQQQQQQQLPTSSLPPPPPPPQSVSSVTGLTSTMPATVMHPISSQLLPSTSATPLLESNPLQYNVFNVNVNNIAEGTNRNISSNTNNITNNVQQQNQHIATAISSYMSSPSKTTTITITATPTITTTTTTTTTIQNQRSRSNSKESSVIGGGSGIIGGMTTWIPSTANIATSKYSFDKANNEAQPQSIAIVAGRKYIMVPKKNVMSVSPAGDLNLYDSNINSNSNYSNNNNSNNNVNGIIDETNGNIQPPINTHVKQLTTGDDLPSFKKRLLARNSKLVSSASSSPDRSSSLMSNANNLPGTPKSAIIDNKNKRQFGTNSGNNAGQVNNSTFASNFFSNVSLGYDVLLHICQYLKVQELLRASCVCRVWNQVAHYSSLWRTVRMKNSQVNDWAGLANTLKRNGTKHLDLRKMLLPSNPDAMWLNFSANIGTLDDLQTIELCRCPASVVEELFLTNPNLKCLNALAIRDTELNINNLSNLSQLTELRLKCSTLLEIENLLPLRELVNLKHLSLTSVNELGLKYIDVLGYLVNLETLELGQCGEFTSSFASDTLINLQKLTRLRLERGQDQCCTFNILDTVSRLNNLVQLELVNFDIKSGFDVRLEQCINLRRLLLIPTYISQSATTNHMILSGVMKLAQYLESFTWVVTLELLRVTELYVDQCDDKKGDFIKSPGESIPVLKPVPGISDNNRNNERTITDVPQVEILSLETVEKIIMEKMPQLNFQILKVAQHATWRQNIVD